MTTCPTDSGIALKGNHKFKQNHQTTEIEISPKPGKNGTLVGKHGLPKIDRVKTQIKQDNKYTEIHLAK